MILDIPATEAMVRALQQRSFKISAHFWPGKQTRIGLMPNGDHDDVDLVCEATVPVEDMCTHTQLWEGVDVVWRHIQGFSDQPVLLVAPVGCEVCPRIPEWAARIREWRDGPGAGPSNLAGFSQWRVSVLRCSRGDDDKTLVDHALQVGVHPGRFPWSKGKMLRFLEGEIPDPPRTDWDIAMEREKVEHGSAAMRDAIQAVNDFIRN